MRYKPKHYDSSNFLDSSKKDEVWSKTTTHGGLHNKKRDENTPNTSAEKNWGWLSQVEPKES